MSRPKRQRDDDECGIERKKKEKKRKDKKKKDVRKGKGFLLCDTVSNIIIPMDIIGIINGYTSNGLKTLNRNVCNIEVFA